MKLFILCGENNISGGYIYYIDKENTVYLTLDDKNMYSLEIINEIKESSNISFSFLVSNGKYLINNKHKLELIDNFNGFKLYFEIDSKKLININNSFIWMKNAIFNKQSNRENVEFCYSVFKNENMNDILINNKNSNSKYNTLYYGYYKSNEMDFSFLLNFEKNNKVVYRFRNLVLLEGSFKRLRNNVICVTDKSLKHLFYFLVFKNAIKPIVFPHNEIILKRTLPLPTRAKQ